MRYHPHTSYELKLFDQSILRKTGVRTKTSFVQHAVNVPPYYIVETTNEISLKDRRAVFKFLFYTQTGKTYNMFGKTISTISDPENIENMKLLMDV